MLMELRRRVLCNTSFLRFKRKLKKGKPENLDSQAGDRSRLERVGPLVNAKPYKIVMTDKQREQHLAFLRTFQELNKRSADQINSDEMLKIRLKWEAIRALPEDLQKAALIEDITPYPDDWEPWSETPPLPKVLRAPEPVKS